MLTYDWITTKRTKAHNKKGARKLEGHDGCPRGIWITQNYRAKIVERPKTLQNKEKYWRLAMEADP